MTHSRSLYRPLTVWWEILKVTLTLKLLDVGSRIPGLQSQKEEPVMPVTLELSALTLQGGVSLLYPKHYLLYQYHNDYNNIKKSSLKSNPYQKRL